MKRTIVSATTLTGALGCWTLPTPEASPVQTHAQVIAESERGATNLAFGRP